MFIVSVAGYKFTQLHNNMCTRDSIMGLSVLWRMTTVHASKGNSSLESVATAIESSRDRKIYRSPFIEI